MPKVTKPTEDVRASGHTGMSHSSHMTARTLGQCTRQAQLSPLPPLSISSGVFCSKVPFVLFQHPFWNRDVSVYSTCCKILRLKELNTTFPRRLLAPAADHPPAPQKVPGPTHHQDWGSMAVGPSHSWTLTWLLCGLVRTFSPIDSYLAIPACSANSVFLHLKLRLGQEAPGPSQVQHCRWGWGRGGGKWGTKRHNPNLRLPRGQNLTPTSKYKYNKISEIQDTVFYQNGGVGKYSSPSTTTA